MTLKSVITALGLFLTVYQVRADHCDVIDTLDNQWINIDSLKNDHSPSYLSEAQVSNREECQQACCQTDKCSVVIFDTKQNHSSINCFLLECTSELECVFETKDGMVTYVIDKKHDDLVKDETESVTNAPSAESSTPGKLTNPASPVTTRNVPKNSTTLKGTTKIANGTVTLSLTKAQLSTVVPVLITKIPTKPSITTTRTATTPAPPPPKTTKAMTSSASVLETTKKTTIGTTTTAKVSMSITESSGNQSGTSKISQGLSTTISVAVTNNTINNSNNVTEQIPNRNNITTDESFTNKEISQLLNITLPGLKVNDSIVNSTIPQIKPPPISTQSFIPSNSSSSLSPSSSTSSSTTASKSSLPSFKSLSTTQRTKSFVLTTKTPYINASSNVTKITRTTKAISTTTEKAALSTITSKTDHTNSTTETTDMNANKTTDLKTIKQDEAKNITNGSLENKLNQKVPSSAVLGGLIALLCFGMFFIIAIMVIFGRKLFESWQRRHYSRIDYLVNGMYN